MVIAFELSECLSQYCKRIEVNTTRIRDGISIPINFHVRFNHFKIFVSLEKFGQIWSIRAALFHEGWSVGLIEYPLKLCIFVYSRRHVFCQCFLTLGHLFVHRLGCNLMVMLPRVGISEEKVTKLGNLQSKTDNWMEFGVIARRLWNSLKHVSHAQ